MKGPARWGVYASLGLACSSPGNVPAKTIEKPRPAVVQPNPEQTDFAAEDYASSVLPTAWVVLKSAFGGERRVQVEVAADGISRARGLMWRTALDEGRGMLFVFPYETVQSFWMRNTLIPLDMIFIGEDRQIKGIIERATPKTLDARSVGRPSRYVLEVPGGWVEKSGIRPESPVDFEGLSGIVVRP